MVLCARWQVQRVLAQRVPSTSQPDTLKLARSSGWMAALQKLEKIRLLMGDEVSHRTRKTLLAGIVEPKLDESIEAEKDRNDFIVGVPAIVDALHRRLTFGRTTPMWFRDWLLLAEGSKGSVVPRRERIRSSTVAKRIKCVRVIWELMQRAELQQHPKP